MENRNFYNAILTEHNLHPLYKHEIKRADLQTEGVNPSCGDDIFLQLQMDGERIVDGGFIGNGCAISQASADIMLDLVIGKTREQALHLTDCFLHMIQGSATKEEIEELQEGEAFCDISHMPARVKCAVLGWHTLQALLSPSVT